MAPLGRYRRGLNPFRPARHYVRFDVVVQEVDKARGRIGLKLVAKHENGNLVQPEELIERAKNAPPRPPEEDRPRGDRDRRGGGRGGRDRDRDRGPRH